MWFNNVPRFSNRTNLCAMESAATKSEKLFRDYLKNENVQGVESNE
jgi:hypothetical protein